MPKKTNTPSKEETPAKDEVVQKINSVKILALWKGFSPDARPYKPSTPIIEFPEPLTIAINVPLETQFIGNADVISIAQLTNQQEPKAQFTPLGMRYIVDQFESAMSNGKDAELEVPASDDEWDEENVSVPQDDKPVKKSDDEEDWGDEDKKEEEDDKPWDEEW